MEGILPRTSVGPGEVVEAEDAGAGECGSTEEMMRFKQNAFLWLLTGCAVIALAVAVSADRWPKGAFVAVRVAVCLASAYAAMKAYRAKREVWTWMLGASAALYNPFVLVRLTRDIWELVNVAEIALLGAAATALRVRDEMARDTGKPSHSEPQTYAALPVAAKTKEYRSPSRTELAIWLSLLFLVLAGVFLAQYDAYLEGTTQSQAQSRNVGAATLGLAVWGYVIALVRRWRRPWRVALAGFVSGVATLLAASATGGYVKGVESNQVLASIGKFDPALETRLRSREGGAPLATMMRSSLARAIHQAPDEAVVAFMRERFAITQSDETKALQRCVAAFNGSGSFHLNSQEQERMLRALGTLYGAAAALPAPPATATFSDDEVFALENVYKKVDPAGVLYDDTKRNALTDKERCRIYTHLMRELQSMPQKKAAAAIRVMLSN